MSVTRPTGDQIRFLSSKTGEHVLDTYLENVEKGSRTLADMLGDLFVSDGTFKQLEFNVDGDGNLEYRFGDTGVFVDVVHIGDAPASATAAAASATSAAASADLAELWAEEDEDTEVDTGRFSSKHWAAKALANATLTTKLVGSAIKEGTTTLNFTNTFTVVDDGSGQVSIGLAQPGVDVQNSGVSFATDVQTINFTGLDLADNGSGRITVTSTVNDLDFQGALLRRTTSEELNPLGTLDTLDWDVEARDTDDLVDLASHASRITIPAALNDDACVLSAGIITDTANSSADIVVQIIKNGADADPVATVYQEVTTPRGVSVQVTTPPIVVNTGDYFEVKYQQNGNSIDIQPVDGTFFSLYVINAGNGQFTNIPYTTITGNLELDSSHMGRVLLCANNENITLTVPSGLNDLAGNMKWFEVFSVGLGDVTLVGASADADTPAFVRSATSTYSRNEAGNGQYAPNVSETFDASFTSNGCLVAIVTYQALDAGTRAFTNIQFDATDMTQALAPTSSGDKAEPGIAIYVLPNPTNGSGTFTLDWNENIFAQSVTLAVFDNINQADPVDGTPAGTGTSSFVNQIATSVTTSDVNRMLVAGAGVQGVDGSPVSWNIGTEIADADTGGVEQFNDHAFGVIHHLKPAAGAQSVQATFSTSDGCGLGVVALNPTASSGTVLLKGATTIETQFHSLMARILPDDTVYLSGGG